MSKRVLNVIANPSSTKKNKMQNEAVNGGAIPMDLDENLHSRQLAVYGRDVMRRMAASSVLIVGMNGLGVEIGERRVARTMLYSH
jgi:ubiquitin-activating enzyme E1